MEKKKKILAINGSASEKSSNLSLIERIKEFTRDVFDLTIYDNLSDLPHFKTELTDNNTPEKIIDFRNAVSAADGIIICTPEYVFSIPSGLKNAIEWCVSTTVFSYKPVGLITASANGIKGHEELKLIMKTIETVYTDETTLLIQGVRGKVDRDGNVTDQKTHADLKHFVESFKQLVKSSPGSKTE